MKNIAARFYVRIYYDLLIKFIKCFKLCYKHCYELCSAQEKSWWLLLRLRTMRCPANTFIWRLAILILFLLNIYNRLYIDEFKVSNYAFKLHPSQRRFSSSHTWRSIAAFKYIKGKMTGSFIRFIDSKYYD